MRIVVKDSRNRTATYTVNYAVTRVLAAELTNVSIYRAQQRGRKHTGAYMSVTLTVSNELNSLNTASFTVGISLKTRVPTRTHPLAPAGTRSTAHTSWAAVCLTVAYDYPSGRRTTSPTSTPIPISIRRYICLFGISVSAWRRQRSEATSSVGWRAVPCGRPFRGDVSFSSLLGCVT